MMLKNKSTKSTTLAQVLSSVARGGERGLCFVSMSGQEKHYSYAQLEISARCVANALLDEGIKDQSRVALLINDQELFLIGFLGVVLAGAVAVPLNSHFGGAAGKKLHSLGILRHILNDCGASVILCADEAVAELDPILHNQADLKVKLLGVRQLMESTVEKTLPDCSRSDAICFLQYTSGSTSMPKGVAVSHANVIANANAFLGAQGCLEKKSDDLVLGWLPPFHDMGLMCISLGPIVADLPAVILPTKSFSNSPLSWLKAISRYKATMTFAPNFAYAIVAKYARERELNLLDLSRLRVAGCGAEPINPDVVREFIRVFSGCGLAHDVFVPCYGMAEATVAIAFHPPKTPYVIDKIVACDLRKGFARAAGNQNRGQNGDEADPGETTELVSCGRVIPGHSLKIVDENNKQLAPREVGEICFQGPSVTQGYFGQPDTTQMSYREGWLYTGDLGYVADGNLFVCGRKKDLIIINGINYYPQDIEWAVSHSLDLRPNKVVAFGVDSRGRERVIICLEYKGYKEIQEIKHMVRETVLENIGIPADDVVVLSAGALTLTSSGKVQRRATKQRYEQGCLHVENVEAVA